jgi:hypothetical protein
LVELVMRPSQKDEWSHRREDNGTGCGVAARVGTRPPPPIPGPPDPYAWDGPHLTMIWEGRAEAVI